MDEKWLETIIARHQEESSLSHILGIECSPAVPKGENYLSIVDRCKIKVLTRSGRNATISLIVKKIPEGAGKVKLLQESGAFKREISVFTTLINELENLMNECEAKEDRLWAELVGYQAYDMLIFQDLTAENFEVLPRRGCQDLNHALLTLSELGRFHAMTKMLLSRGFFKRDEYPVHLIAQDENIFRLTAGVSITKMGQIMERKWGPEWVELGKRLKNSADKIWNSLKNIPSESDEKFLAIIHGDMWTCNIMFKHAAHDKRPTALRLIDFQLTTVETVAWDLTYYIFTSVEPSVRRENFNLLLETYCKSLKENLLKMGGSPNLVLTSDEILKEMNRLMPLRMACLCFFHAIMTADCQDAFDLEDCLSGKNGKDPGPKESCFTDELFKKRIGPDIKILADLGYI